MKYSWLAVVICLIFAFSSEDAAGQEDSTSVKKKTSKSSAKEGWKTGIPIPIVSFDQDLGFQYGIALDLFDFGRPSVYPAYKHKFYFEWSRTTRGTGVNRIFYDSEYLIPKIRLTADVSYLTEKSLQFFGFNGYDAVYNRDWEDEDSDAYRSRVFYRHDRKIFRVLANFQGKLLKGNDKLYWIAGFTFFDTNVGTVDTDKLSGGNSSALPDTALLFDKYVDWGIIRPEEKDGNITTYLKAGLIYDSRDFEFFPAKGLWSEATFSYAPSFLGDRNFEYSKLTLIHRHYLSLGSKDVVFAYRLGYQTTLSGSVPFHIQPHIIPTFMTAATSQGLGGATTLRGIMRNRVVGDAIVLGNAELRWKFLKTNLGKNDLYFGTNAFIDMGQVVRKINFEISQEIMDNATDNGDLMKDYFDLGSESLHSSAGLGLKIGYNENQIVSIDYGFALDNRDGKSGLYIRFFWLF